MQENQKLRLMPAEEELERAMDAAMQEIEEPPSSDASENTAQDLIRRSKDSFQRNLTELKVKEEKIREQVSAAKAHRVKELAKLDTDLATLTALAEADLFQITVLEQAIEAALSTLERADE